ncbi:MAG TPA: glycosyltransferase family 2 protein [Candidatus Krumholzibacteria bacterium]|nr:glycosyltransferase family 2 protein [Candidatus Krumholzibacteria bacterium]
MTVGAILPALNAARFLPDVIADIRRRQPGLRVLVVDDGSTDGTADTARQAGAEVIVHEVNKGKGEALKTGYRWALESGIDWVFTMDSDGQHLPAEMQGFLDAVLGDRLDVVVGTRMARTEGMPWIRLMTNRFTSWVVSRLAGCPIPDSQNGYRLYRTRLLDGVRLKTSRYDSESEILVRLARRGARIGSAPISTVYGDEKSSINPFVDTGRFFRLVLMLMTSRD